MKNWYVMRVAGGRECAVRDKLNARFKDNGDPFEAVVPCKEKWFLGVDSKHKKDCKLEVIPEYPGYIFLVTDWNGYEAALKIHDFLEITPDAYAMLSYGKPTLKDSAKEFGEIMTLNMALKPDDSRKWEWLLKERWLFNENGVIANSVGFMDGDTLRITDGPLKGEEGRIKSINTRKREAEIELISDNDNTNGESPAFTKLTIPLQITRKFVIIEKPHEPKQKNRGKERREKRKAVNK